MFTNEIVVHYELHYDILLYPTGRPPIAGAGTEHRRRRVYAGEKALFPVTVRNAGTMAGTIELRQTLSVPDGWTISLVADDGETLLTQGSRDRWFEAGYFLPGQERDVMLVVTVPEDDSLYRDEAYAFLIEASFQERTDAVSTLPVYIDGVYPIEYLWDPLRLDVDLKGVAIPGIDLNYVFQFHNASEVDVRHVTIVNHLSKHLDFLEITGTKVTVLPSPEDAAAPLFLPAQQSAGTAMASVQSVPKVVALTYDPVQHALIWEIENFPHGGSGELHYRTRVVPQVPAGEVIEVVGTLQSDLTQVVAVSNVVVNVILPSELVVTVSTDEPMVQLGDVSTLHVDVANLNPVTFLEDIDLVIQLPPGLTYRKGTSKFDGTPIADPVVAEGKLVYTIPYLEHEDTARITFAATVNAAADYELDVFAQASVERSSGQRVQSAVARLRIFVARGIFSDEGVILGRVLLSDGRPAPGVRVVLDNGRYSVTDANGHFSFIGLNPGPRVLRLDPGTLAGWVAEDTGDQPGSSPVRVVVPAGGIVTAQIELTPSEIEIQTTESLLAGGGW